MKFPIISSIATTEVVSIDIDCSLLDAIELMLKNDHRNIIVRNVHEFYILTVLNILHIKGLEIDLKESLRSLNLSKIPRIHKNKNILDALEFLNSEQEYIAVVNDDKTLYGIITHTNITSNIDPDTLMDNFRLADFLKLGRRVKWIHKEKRTSKLLKDMIEHSFDNVVIVENRKPLGILTTKDIMTLIKKESDLELSVSHYMSSPVNSIKKNASIKEALNFINSKHYKRVVVTDDNGNLSGIISQKELIYLTYSRWAVLMKEHQEELSELNAMLENKNREYEKMASTDALTGLYNRHKFSELYLSAYQTMLLRHNKMALVMLDIDHFKRVNDSFGHNVGDQVLVEVSKVLTQTLRNIDVVCRWGGEEFVVLIPTASLETALGIAEKLRESVERLDIGVVKITASFGVTELDEGDMMQEVIERADKALYLAKHSGRNCVKSSKD